MQFTNAAKNLIVSQINITHISLHTGDPLETGINEASWSGYSRRAAGFSAAVSGRRNFNSTFTYNVPPGYNISHIGMWNGSVFVGSKAISPRVFSSLGNGGSIVITGPSIADLPYVGVGEYSPELPPPAPDGKSLKTAILPYGSSYLPTDKKELAKQWIADNFDFVINGGADLSYNPDIYYSDYVSVGTYPVDIPIIKAFAEARGWNTEDMFQHMRIDYTPAAVGWKDRDKFTVFNDSVNISTSAFVTTSTNNLGTTIHIGHEEPFDIVNFLFSAIGSNVVYTLDYWNGAAWVTQPKTDGTNSFVQDGSLFITPQATWTPSTILTETIKKFWLKLTITSATVKPVLLKMNGDNWYTGVKCRGWDENSTTIINKGTLVAYNPTPPAEATAKFRQQGRLTGYWTVGNQQALHPERGDGTYLYGPEYIAQKYIEILSSSPNTNAFMWDTAFTAGISTYVADPPNAEQYSDIDDYFGAMLTRYQYVLNKVDEVHPDKLLGGNLWAAPIAAFDVSDWAILEYYDFDVRYPAKIASTTQVYDMEYSPERHFYTSDGWRTEHNPHNTKGVLIFEDLLDWELESNSHWDRSSRSPMVALAKYYMGYNENTYFAYHNSSKYYYGTANEIFKYKYNSTLSQELIADITTSTKTIKGDFSALYNNPVEHDYITNYYKFRMKRVIRIGDEHLEVTRVDTNTVTTVTKIRNTYPAGTPFKIVGFVYAHEEVPKCEDVHIWNWWFPAMNIDIGIPDINGHNGGERDIRWKLYSDYGWAKYSNVWRRDFTKAIVLLRGGAKGVDGMEVDYATPCDPIVLGGTYYPIKADGTIGAGITSISLRAAEGAILLKSRP